MNKKLKAVFCNTNPVGNTGEIPVTAIDASGNVLHGTIHAETLYNWLGREVNFTPVQGLSGGTGEQNETAQQGRRIAG